MNGRCLRCAAPLSAPGTPAQRWTYLGWQWGELCGECLRKSAGSLLYRVRPGLRAAVQAWQEGKRAAWLSSLSPFDREAWEGDK